MFFPLSHCTFCLTFKSFHKKYVLCDTRKELFLMYNIMRKTYIIWNLEKAKLSPNILQQKLGIINKEQASGGLTTNMFFTPYHSRDPQALFHKISIKSERFYLKYLPSEFMRARMGEINSNVFLLLSNVSIQWINEMIWNGIFSIRWACKITRHNLFPIIHYPRNFSTLTMWENRSEHK